MSKFSNTISPVKLELLLALYYRSGADVALSCESLVSALSWAKAEKLVAPCAEEHDEDRPKSPIATAAGWKLSSRGTAYVDGLLRVALPEALVVWHVNGSPVGSGTTIRVEDATLLEEEAHCKASRQK